MKVCTEILQNFKISLTCYFQQMGFLGILDEPI